MYRILAVTAVPTPRPTWMAVTGAAAAPPLYPYRDPDGAVFWSVDGRRPRRRARSPRPVPAYPGARTPGHRDWIQGARSSRRNPLD